MNIYRVYLKSFLVSLFFIASCSPQISGIKHADWELINVEPSIPKDDSIEAYLKEFRTILEREMKEEIGFIHTDLIKAQPEGTMGNFMVDLQLSYAKKIDSEVDISVLNNGGIRIPYLPKGPITIGNIYEMMPFENKLVILEIPGHILITFTHLMASYNGWPIAGLTYQISDKQAQNILVNGQTVDSEKTYKVAISDYLANGGDQCLFLKPLNRTETNITIRNLLIEELKERGASAFELHFEIEERVTHHE